jgi:SAM-dependent MidA family methyltransferase
MPAPSPEAAAHSERVRRHIAGQIEGAGGWIGFDRYMELALYAPRLGYYTAGAHKIGDAASGGDFVTAPELSPLFGRSLAAQFVQVFGQLGPATPARVLEFGAGSGRLARDVIEALAARGVRLAEYAIVEVSADLRARQRQLLAGLPVIWLDAPPVSFEGVVVANEVLDVMPVRVFAKGGGAVLERGVALRDGALVCADRPAETTLAAAVAALEGELGLFADGYASEVGFVARAWVAQLAQTLARGAAFLVDYGFPRREYYHPQRLMGTLMCHYRHHAHAEPLWLPGLNDITAHVDWTAMAEVAHEGGLDVLGYTSQAHFLVNCGLLDWLAADPTPARTGESARLLSEAEMGELFKVLAAGRGIDVPLAGFARGDRTHTL